MKTHKKKSINLSHCDWWRVRRFLVLYIELNKFRPSKYLFLKSAVVPWVTVGTQQFNQRAHKNNSSFLKRTSKKLIWA